MAASFLPWVKSGRKVKPVKFEESLKKLEEMSEKIKDSSTTLEEAVACYEEGIRCYEACNEMLKNAEQKIEVFSR